MWETPGVGRLGEGRDERWEANDGEKTFFFLFVFFHKGRRRPGGKIEISGACGPRTSPPNGGALLATRRSPTPPEIRLTCV